MDKLELVREVVRDWNKDYAAVFKIRDYWQRILDIFEGEEL